MAIYVLGAVEIYSGSFTLKLKVRVDDGALLGWGPGQTWKLSHRSGPLFEERLKIINCALDIK